MMLRSWQCYCFRTVLWCTTVIAFSLGAGADKEGLVALGAIVIFVKHAENFSVLSAV
jgi:hypothetical protein